MNKLHFGSGVIYLDGWVNLDISTAHKTDVCGDVLQVYFEENSFDVIYGCHSYEHISFPNDAVEVLNRFYKWLKPNGILRLAVPDLELAVNAYVSGGDLSFLYGNGFKGYYHKDCKADRLNFFVKAWEHQCCYDFELLGSMLQDAGFRYIEQKEANQSMIPNFNHDRFISESLYVEAIK